MVSHVCSHRAVSEAHVQAVGLRFSWLRIWQHVSNAHLVAVQTSAMALTPHLLGLLSSCFSDECSDDLLLSDDGQQRRASDQRLPGSLQSARDLSSLDATSSSMLSTGSATFLQPSSQVKCWRSLSIPENVSAGELLQVKGRLVRLSGSAAMVT